MMKVTRKLVMKESPAPTPAEEKTPAQEQPQRPEVPPRTAAPDRPPPLETRSADNSAVDFSF